jgi:hypothetical protein
MMFGLEALMLPIELPDAAQPFNPPTRGNRRRRVGSARGVRDRRGG